MSERSDTTAAPEQEDGQSIGHLPHFAFRAGGVRPPVKPMPMGSTMSDRQSVERVGTDRAPAIFPGGGSDRTPPTGFTPQPARRITEIPSPASVKAAEAESEGKRLVIGRQVKIAGEISGCAHLTVEGAVDAKLEGVRGIDVAANGVLKGAADVDTAVIAGTFEGTLIVRGHLDIAASGQVRGTITYRAVTIATGGRISGTVATLED